MKNQMNTIVKTHQMPPQDPYKPDIQTLDKQTQQDYDHTFIFNEQAHIIEADPALYKNLGYSRDEFLNMNLSDLEFLESPKNLSDILNQIRNAGKITKKNIHRRKDGSSIFVTEG